MLFLVPCFWWSWSWSSFILLSSYHRYNFCWRETVKPDWHSDLQRKRKMHVWRVSCVHAFMRCEDVEYKVSCECRFNASESLTVMQVECWLLYLVSGLGDLEPNSFDTRNSGWILRQRKGVKELGKGKTERRRHGDTAVICIMYQVHMYNVPCEVAYVVHDASMRTMRTMRYDTRKHHPYIKENGWWSLLCFMHKIC